MQSAARPSSHFCSEEQSTPHFSDWVWGKLYQNGYSHPSRWDKVCSCTRFLPGEWPPFLVWRWDQDHLSSSHQRHWSISGHQHGSRWNDNWVFHSPLIIFGFDIYRILLKSLTHLSLHSQLLASCHDQRGPYCNLFIWIQNVITVLILPPGGGTILTACNYYYPGFANSNYLYHLAQPARPTDPIPPKNYPWSLSLHPSTQVSHSVTPDHNDDKEVGGGLGYKYNSVE